MPVKNTTSKTDQSITMQCFYQNRKSDLLKKLVIQNSNFMKIK